MYLVSAAAGLLLPVPSSHLGVQAPQVLQAQLHQQGHGQAGQLVLTALHSHTVNHILIPLFLLPPLLPLLPLLSLILLLPLLQSLVTSVFS